VDQLPTEIRRNLILSVGTHRSERPLSPVEVAEVLEMLIGSGATPQDIATALHLENATMIGRFRRLLRLDPTIRHVVTWGKSPSSISLTVASELARLDSAEAQQQVVDAALENELKSSEVRQIVQILQRSQQSTSEATQSVLRLRPQVIRRHVIVGAVFSPGVRAALTGMTQSERDSFLIRAVRKHQPGLPSFSGRLATERFTLVGGDELAAALKSLPDGFESAVNSALEAEAPGS
jgi:ParB-like chromosome segregation protein Spo0J